MVSQSFSSPKRSGIEGEWCGCISDVRARPEQEDHDQRMRKTDFGAIHGAVAGALKHGKKIMVARVEDDALDGSLSPGGAPGALAIAFASMHACMHAPDHCARSRRRSKDLVAVPVCSVKSQPWCFRSLARFAIRDRVYGVPRQRDVEFSAGRNLVPGL